MKKQEKRNTYQIINLIIAGIIVCIFLYSSIFSGQETSHPIPSVFTKITGQPSISTGLSRSFSAIIRGDIVQAQQLNSFGLGIFLFFTFQLVLRVVLFFLIEKVSFLAINKIRVVDIGLSVLTFVLAFKGFIIFMVSLFGLFLW